MGFDFMMDAKCESDSDDGDLSCCESQTAWEPGQAEELTQFQRRSWIALHNAVRVCQEETFNFLYREFFPSRDEPHGAYHRPCYQD